MELGDEGEGQQRVLPTPVPKLSTGCILLGNGWWALNRKSLYGEQKRLQVNPALMLAMRKEA